MNTTLTDCLPDNFSHIPKKLKGLVNLSYNLWWSWHPEARILFKNLDRQAWKESVHNPIRMLKELPREFFELALKNPDYMLRYDTVMSRFREDIESERCWFTENIADSRCLPIAYFSVEYGLHHSLPFYAGGLGFLAGDHIKESSDLGIPLVAVGFMYPEGYFRQEIRVDGWQEDVEETLDREAAPIMKVMDGEGKQLVVKVPVVDPPIYVAVWKVPVGRVSLYLMDTDIEMNAPWHREISARLYVGDLEHRLVQEIVLGIGGSEVLHTLGIKDYVLHLNEGHTAFAILERIRKNVEEGMSYDEATHYVRKTSIFTTHTPVPAGHDVFPFHLMKNYFSRYCSLSGMDQEAFLKLGTPPEHPSAGFNMTVFALRMTEYHNGVSKRHGEVARHMWNSLWPDKKTEDVPIDSITNGIHVSTWVEPKIELLFNKYLGENWKDRHDDPGLWKAIDTIPSQELWNVYNWLKIKLIGVIRNRVRRRWMADRVDPLNVVTSGTLLDPTALTIGFCRRFATYKRAYLIFHDLDRLKRMINSRWRPVQFIFAGKAHPLDDEGKRVLQRVYSFACDPDLGGRIAFVENYDEQIAQYLIHGVDLWLNNPLPPLEACGTSGMKAAVNGVPHLSILDGWWIEGYNGRNGWAFEGNGEDKKDAAAIYDLLEKEIIPLYYKLDNNGIPHDWIKVMKEAMKGTSPQFNSRRMVKEYVTKFYQHALKSVQRETGVKKSFGLTAKTEQST